ncbi:sulfoxide reductase heme-binding subunit YedZ [Chloroflexi bacterium TSY]|nr:sulfoxide reductase heme-binding subunit YedZ [Chloroflexi bacterium TSY]
MNTTAQYVKKHWFWIVVNLLALIPLMRVIRGLAFGDFIDPIGEITDITGYAALVLLVLSLAATPIVTVTGFRKAATVRKSLGLQGFMYVSLHLLVFIGLDYGFSLDLILGDALLSKRYVIVGFVTFLLLLPLAITSTKGWMKRLGKNWKRLHRLVYLAVPLAVLHYVWVEKVPVEPAIWGIVVTLLLIARIPSIRRRLNDLRRKLDGSRASKLRTSTT